MTQLSRYFLAPIAGLDAISPDIGSVEENFPPQAQIPDDWLNVVVALQPEQKTSASQGPKRCLN
jgi:hypothetical protein